MCPMLLLGVHLTGGAEEVVSGEELADVVDAVLLLPLLVARLNATHCRPVLQRLRSKHHCSPLAAQGSVTRTTRHFGSAALRGRAGTAPGRGQTSTYMYGMTLGKKPLTCT